MENPYAAPETDALTKWQETGFYGNYASNRMSSAKKVYTDRVYISTEENYIRVIYLPIKSLWMIQIIFALVCLILSSLVSLGAILAIFAYGIIKWLVLINARKKIEFSLSKTEFQFNEKSKLCGFSKSVDGKELYFSFNVPRKHDELIKREFRLSENHRLKKSLVRDYRLIAILIWFMSMLLGFTMLWL